LLIFEEKISKFFTRFFTGLVAERSPYSTQLEIDTFLSFWLPIPFIPASLSTSEK